MAKKTPNAWSRLLKAARQAQDILQSEHANLTTGEWDSDEVMQVFEDIECALLDIAESKINADVAPEMHDLLQQLVVEAIAGQLLDKTVRRAQRVLAQAEKA